MYAIGGNWTTAELSGINAKRTTALTYILASVIAAVGAIYMAARVGSGDPNVGESYSMDAITVCALGGISLAGGRGNIASMIGAAFTLSSISTILNLVGVSTYLQYVVKGGILLAAVVVMEMRARQKKA